MVIPGAPGFAFAFTFPASPRLTSKDSTGSQDWFLSRHEDGSVFGPLRFEQVQRWAADRPSRPPGQAVARSTDLAQGADVAAVELES